jgi:hypothetical protein
MASGESTESLSPRMLPNIKKKTQPSLDGVKSTFNGKRGSKI